MSETTLRKHQCIPFLDVNSASYFYMGEDYATDRYSRKISEMYPRIRIAAPYYDPLYAIVDINEERISVRGKRSSFVGPSPAEMGMPEEENDYPLCAEIRDRVIPRGERGDRE